MANLTFLINAHVIGLISQFVILGFAVIIFYQRKLNGYYAPLELVYVIVCIALQSGASIFMAGFQFMDTEYYYTVQQLFSLLMVMFLFSAYMKYPENQIAPAYTHERNLMYLILGGEIALNAAWLIFLFTAGADAKMHPWLGVIPRLFLPFSLLWLTTLIYRRARTLRMQENHAAALFMERSCGTCALAVGINSIVATRGWLDFSTNYHGAINTYGWMFLFVVNALLFLSERNGERPLAARFSWTLSLILILIFGLATYIFSASLIAADKTMLLPKELDAVLRPIVLLEVILALFLFFLLPRILRTLLPDETITPSIALTSRQVVVMKMLAEGASNKKIAQDLNITERTVKFHITSLMGIFGKASRYDLGQIARAMIQKGEL